MIRLLPLVFVLAFSGTSISAGCDQISSSKAIYQSILRAEASRNSVRQLQQALGVYADGIWGRRSQAAYENFVNRCNSYSYPRETTLIGNVKVTDFYREKTVFESVPYEVCSNQKQPIYGEVLSDNDPGAFVGGAIVGGILGKAITEKDGGAAIGAIIGGALANESQKGQTTTKIIGYSEEIVCGTKYKKIPGNITQYSHSTIKFLLEGIEYTLEFNKK